MFIKAEPVPIIVGVLLLVLAVLINKKPSADTSQNSNPPTDPKE